MNSYAIVDKEKLLVLKTKAVRIEMIEMVSGMFTKKPIRIECDTVISRDSG